MPEWKVAIAYERYGYITVNARTRKDAITAANKKLKDMTLEEMDSVTEYLPDSESVDEEMVEEVSE